ncbi:MAG: HEAT repeat domain-containing protein [Acidimicrobiia bacterium]
MHLLDPDDPVGRARLTAALLHEDARPRRIAVALLAESREDAVAVEAVRTGYGDRSRLVRRTAVDVAADLGRDSLRDLFHGALEDEDPWIRWRAVRGLRDLGLGASRDLVAERHDDEDFHVRFEVARALRNEDE